MVGRSGLGARRSFNDHDVRSGGQRLPLKAWAWTLHRDTICKRHTGTGNGCQESWGCPPWSKGAGMPPAWRSIERRRAVTGNRGLGRHRYSREMIRVYEFVASPAVGEEDGCVCMRSRVSPW